MTVDDRDSDESEVLPVPVKRRMPTPKQVTYIMLAAVLSIMLGGGALPQGYSFTAPAAVTPAVNDPSLQAKWQSLSAFVMEQSLTPAMTVQERLKHEAEQTALLNPKEEPVSNINVRIPLLPGPVQRMAPIPASVTSTAAQLAPPPVVDAKTDVQPVVAEVKPAKPTVADENMATLKALQDALKELKADGQTTLTPYRNDQINQ